MTRESLSVGYREAVRFLTSLGFNVPTYSAVAKRAMKIPVLVLKEILRATIGLLNSIIAAIDGTGLSIPRGSEYYYRRIDGNKATIFRKY